MRRSISDRVWLILACPFCGGSLSKSENGAFCLKCNEEYPYSPAGQLDLRLRRKKRVSLAYELNTDIRSVQEFDYDILREKPSPEVDFSSLEVPRHMTQTLMSYFPSAKGSDSVMLDIGCGEAIHKTICERAGFEYVGLDFESAGAAILADAQALPFKDDCMEFVLSIAMLHLTNNPFMMTQEVYRVLRAGCRFIGTAAFLQPFHDHGFYHPTHFGIFNLLDSAGFKIEKIAPGSDYNFLTAHVRMGALFPKMPFPLSKSLVFPLDILHRTWWRLGYIVTKSEKASEKQRMLATTGYFSFVCSKET